MMNSKSFAVAVTAFTLCGGAYLLSNQNTSDALPKKALKTASTYKAPSCGPTNKKAKKNVGETDEKVRASAQKGLDFLMVSTSEWQERNQCFGCHVQGVAGEAVSVGLNHQYEIKSNHQQTIFDGILKLNGGLRNDTGHASKNGGLRPSSRAYGGAAIARYDEFIGQEYSDDLLTAAMDLLEHQVDNGSVSPAHTNPPVSKGEIQTTYLAIQTWRQAYERSADERWLTAIANSEGYLQTVIDGWYKNPTNDVQLMNYAMLGLLNAGVGSTERVIEDLKSRILEAQNKDGSWTEISQSKHALTTGQTVYALRKLGMNDSDKPIKKAISYLMKSQQEDGGWSDGGSEKAAAMWAVLGLVATDVMSLNVVGVKNGQHVSGYKVINVQATDNEGVGVSKVEIAIDDVLVHGQCGEKAAFTWNTKDIEKGVHTVDIIATNKAGNLSKRRITVYAGNHYLTNVGTRFEQNKTVVSVRDIAPTDMKHNVSVKIYESKNEKPGKKVFTKKLEGKQGPLSIEWDGKTKKGKQLKSREFIAELVFTDKKGRKLHVEQIPFVHDTAEAQRRDFAELQGRIAFEDDGAADMANAEVELLDEQGNVVQSVRSTRNGQYRFRNLKDGKKYKVRAKKKGFKSKEKSIEARKNAPATSADFGL